MASKSLQEFLVDKFPPPGNPQSEVWKYWDSVYTLYLTKLANSLEAANTNTWDTVIDSFLKLQAPTDVVHPKPGYFEIPEGTEEFLGWFNESTVKPAIAPKIHAVCREYLEVTKCTKQLNTQRESHTKVEIF